MKPKTFLSIYWKSLIIISGILYLSFAPPSTFKGVPSFENEDKLVHLIMYAGLTCFLIFDFRQYAKNKTLSVLAFILICLLFPVFLGGAVEILQPVFFAPRTAEWFDDIAGVMLGWLVSQMIKPFLLKISVR